MPSWVMSRPQTLSTGASTSLVLLKVGIAWLTAHSSSVRTNHRVDFALLVVMTLNEMLPMFSGHGRELRSVQASSDLGGGEFR